MPTRVRRRSRVALPPRRVSLGARRLQSRRRFRSGRAARLRRRRRRRLRRRSRRNAASARISTESFCLRLFRSGSVSRSFPTGPSPNRSRTDPAPASSPSAPSLSRRARARGGALRRRRRGKKRARQREAVILVIRGVVIRGVIFFVVRNSIQTRTDRVFFVRVCVCCVFSEPREHPRASFFEPRLFRFRNRARGAFRLRKLPEPAQGFVRSARLERSPQLVGVLRFGIGRRRKRRSASFVRLGAFPEKHDGLFASRAAVNLELVPDARRRGEVAVARRVGVVRAYAKIAS